MKRYKIIMVSDGSTIAKGFNNALSAQRFMRHHKDYSVLSEKEWKVVRDYEEEEKGKKP